MLNGNEKPWFGERALVVGTLHDLAGLGEVRGGLCGVDVLEWRADLLDGSLLEESAGWLHWPVLLTVRDAAEGGGREMMVSERRRVFQELMPFAQAVDVELRNLQELSDVVEAARGAGKWVVASFHDFCGVPGVGKVRELARRGRDGGADCFKLATRTDCADDVAGLLRCVDVLREYGPFALMGMGRLGAASRPLFAACGSRLNYGWLGNPLVPGQPGAQELAGVILRTLGWAGASETTEMLRR